MPWHEDAFVVPWFRGFRGSNPLCIAVVAALTVATLRIGAVTRLTSADGQFWDVQDTSPWGQDSGGIATGGRAYPFNGFGYLKLQVRRPIRAPLVRNHYLAGFGLASDTHRRHRPVRFDRRRCCCAAT